MSHEVDSMFYAGATPWHGLGTPVTEALSSGEALLAAGLDWRVMSQSVLTEDGQTIEGYRVNRRDDTGDVLGLVSDRYKVVQNAEAFAWVDELMGQGVRFETAGGLKGGQRVWMTAKLPDPYKIAGDPVTTYLTFTNGHDGRHAVQVVVSPVRVVCQNTLNYALSKAPRSWSAIHALNIHTRMDEARRALSLTAGYMEALDLTAERWASRTLTSGEWHEWVEELVPAQRVTSRVEGMRMALETAMYRPDQEAFRFTGWGAANAVAWLTTHQEYPKNRERAMTTFLDGDRMMTRLVELLGETPEPADLEEVEV